MIGVRARQREAFRALPAMDQLTCTRFFWSRSTRLETRTKGSNRWASYCVGAKPGSALKALAWTSAQATDCDLKSRSRKSISVWDLSLSLSFLSYHTIIIISVAILAQAISARTLRLKLRLRAASCTCFSSVLGPTETLRLLFFSRLPAVPTLDV